MEPTTDGSQGHFEQSPLFRLTVLMGRLEEKFVQQLDRIAFHHNDTGNEYRVQERRLSDLMLEKTISDEKHLEYAQKIIALADSYKQGFLRSLQQLNDEIALDLVEFRDLLRTVPKETDNAIKTTSDMERWLALSRELHLARLGATKYVNEQNEFDTFLPTIVIKNNGRSDMTLSPEESTYVQTWAVSAASMEECYNNNQRIQLEREPLTKRLLSVRENAAPPLRQSSAGAHPTPKVIHPLEGKVWFRSLKVVYILLWIVGLGISAMLGYGSNDFSTFLIGAAIVAVLLFVAKKVFYYVVLGRTTANEKPGKGFVDLEDLRNSFANVQVNSPDVYQEVVTPFLDSWKVQYGRRIPTEAIELLHQRVTQEMSSIKEKKQKIIDKAAREGATIGIAGLRQNLERVKAEYKGPDREQYNRQLDNFVMSLEAKYGSAIPIDEAAKLHDKLGEEIRETEH
jgi:hypothetical protein